MINKDFVNTFAGSMKETAEKEKEYKEKILKVLVEIANTLNDQNEILEDMNAYIIDIHDWLYDFDKNTDSGDIFNRLVVKNIVIGEE